MKQVYKKPVLCIEYFTLSQTIANGCGAVAGGNSLGRPNSGSKESCGWQMGDMSFWVAGTTGCGIPLDPNTEGMGVCYNNPEGGNSIFAS